MSNFNYMENVPVKIAEKYKPPPRIYQLPTVIVTKLQLPDRHYEESPQYSYDFELERKVLLKIPEYRRMRQAEREARLNRREKREHEMQRQIEEEHKQMLGAVSYPNAAELSSSESEEIDDNDDVEQQNNAIKVKQNGNLSSVEVAKKEQNWQHHNFNSILQPTVLSNDNAVEAKKDIAFAAFEKAIASHKLKTGTADLSNSFTGNKITGKLANTFNYKDFEEDTSSPFDNIELKTINDLDILAQVLHVTQSKANDKTENCEANGEITINKNEEQQLQQSNEIIVPNKLPSSSSSTPPPSNETTTTKVNVGLELMATQHMPTTTANNIPITQEQYLKNSFLSQQHPNNYQVYYNQNFIFSPNRHNPLTADNTSNALQQQPLHSFANNNADNFSIAKSPLVMQAQQQDQEQNSKSKSVPDIIRELRDELRNSEIRRTRLRNHSFNQSEERGESPEESVACSKETTASMSTTSKKLLLSEDECFANLELPLQLLTRNISSMGFPLKRVAKVTTIYGDNDKKIVEHLICLTELLDLGFEEPRISEALLQFDNNKEKALEHLIS